MFFEFLQALKKLALGFGLIALAATVLLVLDWWMARRPSVDGEAQIFRVALVQHASIKALTDGVKGALQALEDRGFQEGQNIKILRFNAEGDIGTANDIAKQVTNGDFDLIISMSTVSLQTVANANKVGRRTKHVFGLVSDPYVAGVGIDPQDHAQHPPYMTGFGSMQPVEATLKSALKMRPQLKRLGLVWNPAEANSYAQTMLARSVCKELGIELVEGSAENSTAVLESANSVVARGVDALWLSGDITVSLAADALINSAKKGSIPVFTSLPPNCTRGALFDLGADYVEIGRSLGNLAADVLEGKNPADVPVENLVPIVFMYNETVLKDLKDTWTIPDSMKQQAVGWINAAGEKKLPPNMDSNY